VPLASEIRHSLEQESNGELGEEPFLRRLEEFMEEEEAARVLKVAIEWGRYGEVFEYDFHTGILKLPEDTTE
jgi:NitT/TauT family transport system ATP-binding protein